MKRLSSQRLTNLVFGLLSMIFLTSCGRDSYWERTLVGPFHGEPFNGQLTTQPASSVQLSTRLVLDLHWEGVTNNPIIRLREAKGTSVWTRVLIPRLVGQEQPRGRITQLTLNEVKAAKDGFKVMLSCDWTGGGKEGGIIYLNTNHTFRSFALGW